MKLYTEEQVKQIIDIAEFPKHISHEDILNVFTPITLPSDEEIVKQSEYIAHNYFDMHKSNHYEGLKEGSLRMAKWMRDKIQGGKK